MFSNLILVAIDFRLKVGGVQYQGKKLGWDEPNPGQRIARNLPVLSTFQGPGPEGSCRKMMGPPLVAQVTLFSPVGPGFHPRVTC